jgi:serralysin
MATAVNVTKTGNNDIDGLLYGTKWSGTVTYTFPSTSSAYGMGYGQGENTASGFAQVSAAQQQTITYAMGLIESYTLLNIDYSTSNSADIRIATSSKANPTSYAYTPGSNAGGDVWFGTQYDYTNPKVGDYYFMTHLHELGHAFGLKHSQETGGVANVAVPAAHDGLEYTVMSYRSYIGGPTNGYTNETYGFPTTYMMNDILALQTLYGADYTTHAEDTVYTWNPTTGQMSVNGAADLLPGANRVFLTIWDGGGNDTYDMSNYTTGVSIDLNPGNYSITSNVQRAYLGTNSSGVAQYAKGNVYNAYLYNNDARSYIENGVGGTGNDTLVGNPVANELDGRGGNDTITTGAGNDTVVYSAGYGSDTIADFTAGAGVGDKIDLTAFSNVHTLADILSHATQVGSDTVIDLSSYSSLIGVTLIAGINVNVSLANDKITLKNVNLNNLNADDFIFSPAPLVKTGAVPTNMSLSGNAVAEGAATGTQVGQLTTTDADSGQSYSYALVDSAGGKFAINGDKLVVAGALDYETQNSYSVTVRVTDSGNQTYDKTFTVNVTNVSPGAVTDSNGAANSVPENSANGTVVGITAATSEPNGGVTYSLTNTAGGRFTINSATGVVTVANGALLDYENATSHTITVQATDGQSTVTSNYTIQVSDVAGATINGTSSANTLNGTGEGETITGQGGNDTLYGFGGNDTLNGGSGADKMYGGTGNDTYVVDNTGDVVYENANEGTDLVQSSVTYTLAANVENLTLTGSSSRNGTGNELNNVITGNSGTNILAGLGGADTLIGGNGTDTATYAASQAPVTVSLWLGLAAGGDAQGDTFSSIENVIGSAYNDVIEGSSGTNKLDGGAGIDTVTYESAGAAVKVSLASTRGQSTGGAGSDTLTNFENLTGSSYNDTLTGSTGNNIIKGLGGDDTISAGNGNDTIIGGSGLDKLTGGSGTDAFVFNLPSDGLDTVTDFVSNSDWLQISAAGFGHGLSSGVTPMLVTTADYTTVTNAGSNGYFIFDNSGTNSGTIYWDPTGGSGSDAIAFVKINGTALLATDFHVV